MVILILGSSVTKYPVFQTEFLSNPRTGTYECQVYWSDGSVTSYKAHKGPIIMPTHVVPWFDISVDPRASNCVNKPSFWHKLLGLFRKKEK